MNLFADQLHVSKKGTNTEKCWEWEEKNSSEVKSTVAEKVM